MRITGVTDATLFSGGRLARGVLSRRTRSAASPALFPEGKESKPARTACAEAMELNKNKNMAVRKRLIPKVELIPYKMTYFYKGFAGN